MNGEAGPSSSTLADPVYAGPEAGDGLTSTQERQRFFPPPFRIDIDLAGDDTDDDDDDEGPSTSVVKQEPLDEPDFVLSVSTRRTLDAEA